MFLYPWVKLAREEIRNFKKARCTQCIYISKSQSYLQVASLRYIFQVVPLWLPRLPRRLLRPPRLLISEGPALGALPYHRCSALCDLFGAPDRNFPRSARRPPRFAAVMWISLSKRRRGCRIHPFCRSSAGELAFPASLRPFAQLHPGSRRDPWVEKFRFRMQYGYVHDTAENGAQITPFIIALEPHTDTQRVPASTPTRGSLKTKRLAFTGKIFCRLLALFTPQVMQTFFALLSNFSICNCLPDFEFFAICCLVFYSFSEYFFCCGRVATIFHLWKHGKRKIEWRAENSHGANGFPWLLVKIY